MTVHKYKMTLDDYQLVGLPAGAEIIKVAYHDADLFLWALVNPEAPTEQRTILVRGTGQPIHEEKLSHIDTVFVGRFVWHVFEVNQ